MSHQHNDATLPPRFFGVSLKMYFGHAETLAWCRRVAVLARRRPSPVTAETALAVMPTFTALTEAVNIFSGTNVQVGAQDLSWHDRGAFTGEVGGPQLREIGCQFVEVGHAERRQFLGESDAVVARKVAAAARNKMTPVLCVGEPMACSVEQAGAWCISQLEAATSPGTQAGSPRLDGIVVAYEPVWAIGTSAPASAEHIRGVCSALRQWLASASLSSSRLIYGGSAGPGLVPELGDCIDGLFLGRSAHDPDNLARILTEATGLGRRCLDG